jgi:uncharacterized protein (UPF0218 family)
MRLIIEQINDQQKKACIVVAKAMNVKVKVEKEGGNIEKELMKAMKKAQLASQGKYPSRPIEDLFSEL